MFHGIFVSAKLELNFDSLFETLETPITLLLLECWDSQELIDRLFGVVCLQLFRIVILVLDVDVTPLFLFVILILKVISRIWSVHRQFLKDSASLTAQDLTPA